jgi:uncharacterized protein
LPEAWIPRTLEPLLTGPAPVLEPFPVWLLLGPRQAGKSSLLKHCASSDRTFVDLDDLDVRTRANRDPLLFMRELKPPFLIDEIQYAPTLLSPIKRLADSGLDPGAIWLTGSQSFEVMAGIRETLAGRVAILNLFGLADEEKRVRPRDPQGYFETIAASTFPKLQGVTDPGARELYLSSYTATYIERDVRELFEIEKRREFEIFVKICALRTAQVVNFQDLARDAGITAVTAKSWLGLLEDSFLVRLLHPYFKSRSKRLTKSPKLYFLDMGLAAHLAGWRDPEMLRLGPMGGAAFETHIFGNILRHFRHRARDVDISFWRTRDGQEIDFLVEAQGACYPIEVKTSTPDPRDLVGLEGVRESHWKRGAIVSLAELGATAPKAVHADWVVTGPEGLSFP